MPKPAQPFDCEKTCRLYKKGWKLTDLMHKFHVSMPRILEALHNGNVELRKRGWHGNPKKIPMNPDFLRECAAKKMTTEQIAKILGCREEVVRRRMVKLGIPRLKQIDYMAGENNQSWNGGKTIDKHGYILVRQPDHPYANSSGYVREHRLKIERKLGRYLIPDEVVHHIDGNPSNNDIDNLKLYSSNAAHLKDDLKGKCPKWTPQGRRRILEAVRKKHGSRASTHPKSETDDEPLLPRPYRPTVLLGRGRRRL